MPEGFRPAKFSKWSEFWKKWHNWLTANDVSALQACLAFPLSFPEVDRVVVGAEGVRQLTQIIYAANNTMQVSIPDFSCKDEDLIDPSRWDKI